MTTADPTLELPARMEALPAALAWIERACERARFEPGPQLRVRLVIEELFTNSVRHGYGEGNPGRIWLTALAGEAGLTVTYEDAAPPYDPLQASSSHLELPVEQRPVGGLGRHLVTAIPDEVRYRYDGGRNVIEMVFDRHAQR